MSVNDILVQGAQPLFFLDYFATGRLDVEVAQTVIGGIARGCRLAGCALLGGETAEMPDMYAPGEYDLAGFCVGIVDNARLIDGTGIQVGDKIIGIASSGLHSNGFSLVRKILTESGLSAEDILPGGTSSIKDTLLEPTAIYVNPVRSLLRDVSVKGMAHITGGGFYDNIPRVLPSQVMAEIFFASWHIPPVFHWIKEAGELTWPEMLQIFNCGIGYVLIVSSEQTDEIINRVQAFNMNAFVIGEISRRSSNGEQAVIHF
jgi:phosphoribosylformylglycinamidine cyclo-ligase